MVISTSCELLLENPLQVAQRGQVERIARAARDMNDLVRTFLLLARSGPAETAETTTLAEVAREQAELWGPSIRAKGLAFELIDEGAGTAGHNPTFLRTAMANLLRNALHYTASGTVRVILSGTGSGSKTRAWAFPPTSGTTSSSPLCAVRPPGGWDWGSDCHW